MAIVDLEAAKARLAALDAEREPLIALIRAAEAYEGVVGKTLFDSGNVTVRQRSRPQGGGRASPTMSQTAAAVTEMLNMMGPLPTSELVDLLRHKEELGLNVDNANNVLSARLSNSDKFESRRPHGWWFKDRPWPGEAVTDVGELNSLPPPPKVTGWGIPSNTNLPPDPLEEDFDL